MKYRLYPTKEQAALFAKTFGCCRKIWNLMLSDKILSYETTKSFGKQTPAMYKAEYPYLKEVDSLALANVQLHLQQAMKNHFASGHCRFPRFKSSKHSRKSYTTNNQKGTVAVLEHAIRLPKVGKVKAVIHRRNEEWRVKSATISQEADGSYYASVLYEFDTAEVPMTGSIQHAIGLDYKSEGLYMDSNGMIGSDHEYYRESQTKLAKAQRRLSRKQGSKKGEQKSRNYLKQQRKVGKIHRHIRNQRLDSLHKQSTEIANQMDVVCVESLNLRSMSNKGFGNGKATLDNGYGMFLNMLEYKLAERGKYFVRIDKWFPSSQRCYRCGKMKKMRLEEREYRCSCGYVCDRDLNAAKNILQEGLRLLRAV